MRMNVLIIFYLAFGLQCAMCVRPVSMSEELSISESEANKTKPGPFTWSRGIPNLEDCYAALKAKVLGHLDSQEFKDALEVMQRFNHMYLMSEIMKESRKPEHVALSMAITTIVKDVNDIVPALEVACDKQGCGEPSTFLAVDPVTKTRGGDWVGYCWGYEDGLTHQSTRQKGSRLALKLGRMLSPGTNTKLAVPWSGALGFANWLLIMLQDKFNGPNGYLDAGGDFYVEAVQKLTMHDGQGMMGLRWLKSKGIEKFKSDLEKDSDEYLEAKAEAEAKVKKLWTDAYKTLSSITDKMSEVMQWDQKYKVPHEEYLKQSLWELCQSKLTVQDATFPTRREMEYKKTWTRYASMRRTALADDSVALKIDDVLTDDPESLMLKDYVEWLTE
mmetsp:Transcript_17624/g.39661  ORF Transcript_17624/g.39661 Transcript_17624/m.39661 type:complete len:388 (+) Transcript_17624:91-1254(+)